MRKMMWFAIFLLAAGTALAHVEMEKGGGSHAVRHQEENGGAREEGKGTGVDGKGEAVSAESPEAGKGDSHAGGHDAPHVGEMDGKEESANAGHGK